MNRWLARLVVFALASLSPAQSSADTRPPVRVEVSLCCAGGESFKALSQRAVIEAALASELAGKLATRFPFAAWSPSAPPAAAALIVRLVEVPNTGPLPRVELRWLMRGPTERALPIDPVPMYEQGDPMRATINGSQLKKRADENLARALTSVFLEQLEREFVRHLPLAKGITLLPGERLVVLPVLFQETRFGKASELRVDFVQAEPPGDGSLQLAFLARRRQGTHADLLQGSVRAASFDSHPVALAEGWSPRLEPLLEGATVACFVEKYVPASELEPADAQGRVITEAQ